MARSRRSFWLTQSLGYCLAFSATNNQPQTTRLAPDYWKRRNTRGRQNSAAGKFPTYLLSGNHAEIAKWRKEQALKRTKQNRPDLLR